MHEDQHKTHLESVRNWANSHLKDTVMGAEIAALLGVENPSSSDYRMVSSLMGELKWTSRRISAGTVYYRPGPTTEEKLQMMEVQASYTADFAQKCVEVLSEIAKILALPPASMNSDMLAEIRRLKALPGA